MSYTRQSDFRQELDIRPLYNIKAVAEATGLHPATLRAWERRYGALTPGRTQSGYRLYSGRDIAILRWLKARIGEGLSISQAIVLLEQRSQAEPARSAPEHRAESWQGLSGSREALIGALLDFEESQADRLLEEVFAVYGLEAVLEHIIAPALTQIGDLWHKGKASTAAEHFASNYLRRKLDAIINAAPRPSQGRPIVLGCAPGDWHEMGLLIIHLLLRRRGLNSLYLGQNVSESQFIEEMEHVRPLMVIIGATTEAALPGLAGLARAISTMKPPRPLFGYGGRIFNIQPQLRADIPGVFLGENARASVGYIAALLTGTREEHSLPEVLADTADSGLKFRE